VVDGDLLLRSGPGPKLQAAERREVVAFEVDDLADDGTSGWSVLVVGVADGLEGSERVRAMSSGLVSARSIATERFVRIAIADVTGRELLPPLGLAADG
jgi:hypothetical protein